MNLIKRQLDKVRRHKLIACLSLMSLSLALCGYVWFIVSLGGNASTLVLHFNSLNGINQYGQFGELAWLGGFGIVLIMIDMALALELADRDAVLSKIVVGAGVSLGALLFIGFVSIIGVN